MSTHQRSCAICQGIISSDTPFGFCDRHLQEFLIRQQEGVTTEALDSRWGDTLENWRERPSILNEEIVERSFASPFIFSMREQDWIIFIRSYYLSKSAISEMKKNRTAQRRTPRLRDSLAINIITGEIRRFVSLPKEVVLEDLRGERPAPYQAELAPFWGNPDLGDMLQRWQEQFYDRSGRLDIPKLVAQAEFPVYGIIDHLAGFALEGLFTCGFSNFRVNSIGFIFSSFQNTEKLSQKICFSSGIVGQVPAGEGLRFLDTVSGYDHYEHLLRFYHLQKDHQQAVASPSIWEGELLIGRQLFIGEIRSWPQPYGLHLFSLRGKGQDSSLEGSAYSFSFGELLQILNKLEIINHNDDVILQYQNERQD